MTRVMQDELLGGAASAFDYGCGRGDDLHRLWALGFTARGWDPVHRPSEQLRKADIVNLGYVNAVYEVAHPPAG